MGTSRFNGQVVFQMGGASFLSVCVWGGGGWPMGGISFDGEGC